MKVRHSSIRIIPLGIIALVTSLIPVAAQASVVAPSTDLVATGTSSTARYIVVSPSRETWLSLRKDLLRASVVIQDEYDAAVDGARVLLTDKQARLLMSDARVKAINADTYISIDGDEPTANEVVAGRYIVQLKSSASITDIENIFAEFSDHILYTYRNSFIGFAAELSTAEIEVIRNNPIILSASVDSFVKVEAAQSNPPWGLDRINQSDLPLDRRYSYASAGAGVDVYVIDSGVQSNHPDFGSRVAAGYPATGSEDCHGHGTHVAGTIASTTYGVAKEARIIPVKVLDCTGKGLISDIVAGIDWAVAHHSTGIKAIANMSIGASKNTTLNNAVGRLSTDGIIPVSAAGNENALACNSSPASASTSLTVAATDSTDTRASFSNYGSCVHMFAPGVNIQSTTMNSSNGFMSGTSMAAPHVSGAAAVYWALNPSLSATNARAGLIAAATSNKVLSPGTGSPNKLLYLAPVAPSTPAAPSASYADGTVTVGWTAPTSSGSDPISSYTVQTNSGLTVCSWTSGPLTCQVRGLPVGSYTFKVAATSAAGTSSYSAQSTSVTVAAVGNNDVFSAARLLTTASGTLADSNTSSSREVGEPTTHGTTDATRWYVISPTTNGTLYVNTNGSSFDTVLGVFSGASVSTLTELAKDDNSGLSAQSALSVAVTANTRYYIQVGGFSASATGSISLEWFASGAGCTTTPTNDAFACATNLAASTGTFSTSSTSATTEANEPSTWLSSRSLWYRFLPAVTSTGTFDLSGSSFDTVLEIFKSSKVNPTFAELTSIASNDDAVGTSAVTSRLGEVALEAGSYYFVRIAGFGNTTTSYGSVSFAWAVLANSVTSPPSAPTGISATEGVGSALVTWSVPASSGSSPISSYTVVSTPGSLSCVTSTTSCSVPNLENFVTYTFTVIARNSFGSSAESVPSNEVTLGYENDFLAGAKPLTAGTTLSSNRLATSEPDEPKHAGNLGGKSMWFVYSPGNPQSIRISTSGSSFDTVVGVYSISSTQSPVTFSAMTNVTSNDDAPGLIDVSEVTFTGQSGLTYYIAVDGYGSGVSTENGSITLTTTITPLNPPSAPLNVKVAPLPLGVEVGWQAPLTNASTVTSYRATVSPGGASCTSSSELLHCSISGLNLNTSYTVSVVAINAVGSSDSSNRSEAFTPASSEATRSIATTWGLDRIDEHARINDGYMSYAGRGEGIRVYIVDTGLRASHSEFAGRVESGYTVIDDGLNTGDCHGHGTHVASSAVGTTLGIARAAKLVPVRVFGCGGSGLTSDIIEGLNWIASQVSANGYRSVVNMSLGGLASSAIDTAVNNLISQGVVVVVAAGNSAEDACGYSPARIPDAITVGATTSTDTEAYFSNYGRCVDLYAPGVSIVGAGIASDQATATMSGTSMASPHVAGYAAVAFGTLLASGDAVAPRQVAAAILNVASSGYVTSLSPGSPNRILYIAADRCVLAAQAGVRCIASSTPTESVSGSPAPEVSPSPTTTVPVPSVAVPIQYVVSKAQVTKTATAAAVAKAVKVKIPTGARVSVAVAKTSLKSCKVSRGRLVVIKTGKCSISLTITPKRGAKKIVKKTVTVAK